jgi:hypothetical protein
LNVRSLWSKRIKTKDSHQNRYIAKDYKLPLRLYWGVFCYLPTLPARRTDAQGLRSDQHPVQLPEIAVVEKSADHVRRDLLGAERVKLVPRREL